jgi:hypothetical protein
MASLPGVGGYKTREGKKPARSCWLPPTTDQIGQRLIAKSKIAASGDDGSPAAHPGPSAQRTRRYRERRRRGEGLIELSVVGTALGDSYWPVAHFEVGRLGKSARSEIATIWA